MNSNIKKHIHTILSQRGTMAFLTKYAKFPTATLSGWKNLDNPAVPNLEDAQKICKALNISINELLGERDIKHVIIGEDTKKNIAIALQEHEKLYKLLAQIDRDIVVPEPVVEEPAPPQHVEEPQEEERAEASHKEIPNTTYFSDDKDGEGDYIDYPAYEIAAGQPILGENSNADIFSVHHSEVKNCTPQTHGIVHVRGDSMINAGIPTGCCALIKYHEHPVENAIMAVWLETQEGVTLKRIRKIDGAIWACWENDTDKRLRVGEDPRDRAIGLFVKVLHRVKLR